MKRFLITTALEETWVDDQPVIFLGEWCRRYSRKERWLPMDSQVVADHWDDREKLLSDYQSLTEIYERVLEAASSQLNQIHGVAHSVQYWRILIGPWLAYFLHALFDRWSSIQVALRSFELTGTVIKFGNEIDLVPNDMGHAVDLMLDDEWNHYIYGCILRRVGNLKVIELGYKKKTVAGTSSNSLKHKLTKFVFGICEIFSRPHDIFLISTYLPKLKVFGIYLRFLQFPQLWRSVEPCKIAVDQRKRTWKITSPHTSEFEKLFFDLLPKQIPTLYLEGYRQLIDQANSLPWPKKPKLIFTANSLMHDTVCMAYAAEEAEMGAPIIIAQHGGFYGLGCFMWLEDHERKIADRYLTWGWGVDGDSKVTPVGITKHLEYRKYRSSNNRTDLLLVLATAPRYTFRLDSDVGVNETLRYILDCLKLAGYLKNTEAYGALVVRLHACDYGWGERNRWADEHPSIRLNNRNKPIWNLVRKSRLVVYTYNSTGYLEFLAAGVPTIVVWDMSKRPVRNSAIPYFEEMKRVGIFHETPESAAVHVRSIWNDVDAWWSDAELQEVVARFCLNYCNRPERLVNRMTQVLKEAVWERGGSSSIEPPYTPKKVQDA